MAAPPPTMDDLQAVILMLQAQIAALQAATPAAPAAGTADVVTFAHTPQIMLNANNLIDNLTKRVSSIKDATYQRLWDDYQPDSSLCQSLLLLCHRDRIEQGHQENHYLCQLHCTSGRSHQVLRADQQSNPEDCL
jgi:hypothetical protein